MEEKAKTRRTVLSYISFLNGFIKDTSKSLFGDDDSISDINDINDFDDLGSMLEDADLEMYNNIKVAERALKMSKDKKEMAKRSLQKQLSTGSRQGSNIVKIEKIEPEKMRD